jgi:hypothetical protein
LVTKVQWMDVKLHRMARDHVPMDGEEDEKWYYSRSNGHYKKMKIHIFFNRLLKVPFACVDYMHVVHVVRMVKRGQGVPMFGLVSSVFGLGTMMWYLAYVMYFVYCNKKMIWSCYFIPSPVYWPNTKVQTN